MRWVIFVTALVVTMFIWPSLTPLQKIGTGALLLAYQWHAFLSRKAVERWARKRVDRVFRKRRELDELGKAMRRRLATTSSILSAPAPGLKQHHPSERQAVS